MGCPSRYPEEFRREAVQLALSSDESRAAVARRLGVNDNVAELGGCATGGGSTTGQPVGGDTVGVRGTASVAKREDSAA